MNKIINYFKSWGMDKLAHLGIGGLICALISIALILVETNISPWRISLVPLGGTVCVSIFAVFKELIDETGFCWGDLIATLLGCLLVELATLFGIVIRILST